MSDRDFHLMVITESSGDARWIFDMFDDITRQDYDDIVSANSTLIPFLETGPLPYVRFSFDQFKVTCAHTKEAFERERKIPKDGQALSFALSCHLLTFLSALVSFADQTIKTVCDNYGKKSTEAAKVREITSSVYDSHFGYRFCYRLRQLVAHRKLSILKVSFTKSGEMRPSGIVIPTDKLNVLVMRDELVAFEGIWSAVKDEITCLEPAIDIIPLLTDAMAGVTEIAKRTQLLIFPDITEKLSKLRDVQARFRDKPGFPMVASVPVDGSNSDGRLNISQTRLLFELLDDVERTLNTISSE